MRKAQGRRDSFRGLFFGEKLKDFFFCYIFFLIPGIFFALKQNYVNKTFLMNKRPEIFWV